MNRQGLSDRIEKCRAAVMNAHDESINPTEESTDPRTERWSGEFRGLLEDLRDPLQDLESFGIDEIDLGSEMPLFFLFLKTSEILTWIESWQATLRGMEHTVDHRGLGSLMETLRATLEHLLAQWLILSRYSVNK